MKKLKSLKFTNKVKLTANFYSNLPLTKQEPADTVQTLFLLPYSGTTAVEFKTDQSSIFKEKEIPAL